MSSLKKQIAHTFKHTISEVFALEADPYIQQASRPEFGDFQANFALGLAKILGQRPQAIAEQIINRLRGNSLFADLVLSGPGFINIKVSDKALNEGLQRALVETNLGYRPMLQPRTIVVDYGGANVAKEMHVGHLRSAIIGDAFVRILTFLGHQVIRQNHIGDWGTQFGMLIEYILTVPEGDQTIDSLATLNHLYKTAKIHFDTDPDFAERARQRVVALQQGDLPSLGIWQRLLSLSQIHFKEVYGILGVLLNEEDIAGESFYNPYLGPMVSDLLARGIAIHDEGAVVIPMGLDEPPFIIQKKDGGFLYATTDLAAVMYRVKTLKAQQIIYVVDNRQRQHFQMLFKAAEEALGMKSSLSLEHTGYGAVLGEDQKPLKTRSGDSIKLIELLEEAKTRARLILKEKMKDTYASEVIDDIASAVGIGALKYADLKADRNKDYVFSWERMLAFEGNTGPYLQNAYVRIQALFRKGQLNPQTLISSEPIVLTHPNERALALILLQFFDVIDAVEKALELHLLCDYLFDLASAFHRFYEHCPILSESDKGRQMTRLILAEVTAKTLKKGLELLGIPSLDRM